MTFTLEAQIAEQKREIAISKNFYAGRVAAKKMKQGEMDLHVGAKQAILDTLFWLQKNEAVVRAAVAKSTPPEGTNDS